MVGCANHFIEWSIAARHFDRIHDIQLGKYERHKLHADDSGGDGHAGSPKLRADAYEQDDKRLV